MPLAMPCWMYLSLFLVRRGGDLRGKMQKSQQKSLWWDPYAEFTHVTQDLRTLSNIYAEFTPYLLSICTVFTQNYAVVTQ